MNDYRMNRNMTDGIIMNELSSQIGYMESVADSNFNKADDNEDYIPTELTAYWGGFHDILSEMLNIMDCDDKLIIRRQRMLGMLDACNAILKMVEAGDFNDS